MKNAIKGVKTHTWTAPTYEEGTTFLWGLGPKLTALVPGLTVWVDGKITGLGVTDGVGTYTGFKVGYASASGSLDSAVGIGFETFPKYKVKKTGFYIDPSISYKVFSWFKPGLEANLTFYSYEDEAKDLYKNNLTNNEDLAGFDKFGLTVYTEFALGNGVTITPRYALTSKSAHAPSIIEDVNSAGTDWIDGRVDHEFQLRFAYSF
jgi:hypothetical protein